MAFDNLLKQLRNMRITTTEQLNNEIKEAVQKEESNFWQKMKDKYGRSWQDKFIQDIYKEENLYPHDEMARADKAFNYNSFVQAAIDYYINMILGGEVYIEAKSDQQAKRLNGVFEDTDLKKYVEDKMLKDLIVAGNTYAERIRGKGGQIVMYDPFRFPHRIYHDLDDDGRIKRFVQEIPHEMSKNKKHQKEIRYYGYRRKSITGTEIDAKKMFHAHMGEGTIKTYGRGPAGSIVNDYAILTEVERAMAIIARYKAIPKKLIMPGDDTEGGEPWAEGVAGSLSGLGEADNPVLPQQAKVEDMSYNGSDLNVQPIVDYLKKKLTVALSPSFLIHGEETRYANSKEQRVSKQLAIKSVRKRIAYFIEKEMKMLAEKNLGGTLKSEDFEVKFGDIDLGEDEEKRKAVIEMFKSGVITLNEARESLGYDEDDEQGEFYYFDLKGDDQEQQQLGDLMGDGQEK